MKFLYLFALLLAGNFCFGQSVPFDTLLNRGKAQFKSDLEKPDYNAAINNLTKAIKLKPENAEAHYFLGYAYSRSNSTDCTTVPKIQRQLTLKASAEFEKVISISPLYTGEMVTLDPYSKLTSEWGALALSYLINNKPDSAAWAFKEGKKRGGFDDFILAETRAVINGCTKNAILLSPADGYTFPLYYLQIIEKLRPDVSFVDVNTLNAAWCARMMEKTTSMRFGIKEPALDTIGQIRWHDSTINIPVYKTNAVFSWILKPSYQGSDILRSDRLFLSMLQENKFKRDVYIAQGFAQDAKLSLGEHLLSYPMIEKLNAKDEKPQTTSEFIEEVQKIAATFEYVNPNSQDEQFPVDVIRLQIIDKMSASAESGDIDTIDHLSKLLSGCLSEKKFPVFSPDLKKALDLWAAR